MGYFRGKFMLKLMQRNYAFTSSHYGSCGIWQGEHEVTNPIGMVLTHLPSNNQASNQ